MNSLWKRIKNDLFECRLNWKLILFFIPVAFFTYLFHEFGHWLFGEITGNKMIISLNNATTANGNFLNKTDALWSAIGGPAFTILQALIFMFIISYKKSYYLFSVIFFAVFSRFFSIIFGGVNLQDEATIATMLNTNKYFVICIVLGILSLILWKSCKITKCNLKSLGYYTVFSTFAILIVIYTNLIFII